MKIWTTVNCSIQKDWSYDLFMNFLKHQSFSCMDCQWGDRKLSDFIKKIFICVRKMNESLTGLEQHESE